ncbi:MAG: TlyA family RNA methyltransferase [Negativicutes bacterium]|nr:TlyA family RNA methyltransferase [Negativicutes bacterium]
MGRSAKTRLDLVMVRRGMAVSRSQAQGLIMAGRVLVGGQPVRKAGTLVDEQAVLAVRPGDEYVSRGGLKLARAVDEFAVDFAGKTVLDAGASTGGFTDCALRHGARLVYAVDVGYGQLHWRLRQDERVCCLERLNIKDIRIRLTGPVDIVLADLSFISLTKVMPALASVLTAAGEMIVLVKPQFEVGRQLVGKGGVVRDRAAQTEAIERVIVAAADHGLTAAGLTWSPLQGPAGNIEYLLHLIRGAFGRLITPLPEVVGAAHAYFHDRLAER